MRSEELALLVGDLTPVPLEGLHAEAAESVVRQGKETGFEYGVAILDGHSLDLFGGESPNRISVPRYSDAPDNSVTIHHNHPIGDSFSRSDLYVLLTRSEIGEIYAHGHNGGVSKAVRIGGALDETKATALIYDANLTANRLIHQAIKKGVIPDSFGNSIGFWQIVMGLVLDITGVIRYAFNSGSLLDAAKKVLSDEQ